MNKTKKVLLIIGGSILGLIAFVTISRLITEHNEKTTIENAFNQIDHAINQKKFDVADSIVNEIDWQVFRVENGEKRLKEYEQKIISSKFRAEVDEMLEAVNKKDISLANQKYSELILESVINEEVDEKDKDYMFQAGTKLEETKSKLMKPYLKQAKTALTMISEKKDEFSKTTWIRDKTSPKFVDQNAFYIYFGEEKDEYLNTLTPLRLRVQYYGDDWLFHKGFSLLIDGETYTFHPDEVKRDSGNGGYVWEWSDQPIKEYIGEDFMAKRLVEIINSKEAKIKFIGDDYYDVKTITQQQKDAMRNVLLSYVAKGEYFKFIGEVIKE